MENKHLLSSTGKTSMAHKTITQQFSYEIVFATCSVWVLFVRSMRSDPLRFAQIRLGYLLRFHSAYVCIYTQYSREKCVCVSASASADERRVLVLFIFITSKKLRISIYAIHYTSVRSGALFL